MAGTSSEGVGALLERLADEADRLGDLETDGVGGSGVIGGLKYPERWLGFGDEGEEPTEEASVRWSLRLEPEDLSESSAELWETVEWVDDDILRLGRSGAL